MRTLGPGWTSTTGIDEEALKRRRDEERKSRDGVALSDDLIAYTHLYELRSIIHKNWEAFKPVLGEKKRFDVYLDRVEDFRNAPAHSRTLLPFERALLEGIVGEYRNKITLHRTTQGPDMQHYPMLEEVSDNLGNRWTLGEEDQGSGARWLNASDPIRLVVGDVVTYACRAFDAQGRALSWTLHTPRGVVADTAEGNEVSLTWTVSEQDVGNEALAKITMKSTGPYHRRDGSHDMWSVIVYTVAPY